MCELLAIVANRQVSASLSWAGLQLGAFNNPDGWGVSWLSDRGFEVKKEPAQLPFGPAGRRLIRGIRSEVFVAHTRYRVQGHRSLANTQPFLSTDGAYAFAGTMNGCLGQRGLRKRVQHRLQGDTGPEVLFQLILSGIESSGHSGMRNAVKEFFATRGLPRGARGSFVFCTRNQVLVYRHRKPLHHLQRVAPYRDHPIHLRGSRHHPYQLSLKEEKVAADQASIVATEKLTDEDWKLVPDRTLFLLTLDGLQPA